MPNPYIFNCQTCSTKCDGVSKKVYTFTNDALLSESHEEDIIALINKKTTFTARKCELEGYPDIEILNNENLVMYLEIKFQRRTFMSVRRLLPQSDLLPSETVALNLSDLVRYFRIAQTINVPVIIVWGLTNRSCVVPVSKTLYFYQDLQKLKSIFDFYGEKRRFRRKSGFGDVVDGVHKGVVVNYHFSLNDMKPFSMKDIFVGLLGGNIVD